MDAPTTTAAGPAPPAPRRTRRTDAWTTLFAALTATLGAWSLALIGLTVAAIVDPSYDAEDDLFDLKAVGAFTVAVIALGQAFTMGAAMGKVPGLGLRMGTLMRTHRRVGRVGLVLAGVVAFFCWRASEVGAPTADGIIHGALASTGFLAIAAKFALLKWRPAVAFGVAPWLGSSAALAFILVAATAILGDDLFDLDELFGGEDGGRDGDNSGPGGGGDD